MMKNIIFIMLIPIILSACSAVRIENVKQNTDKTVDLPLKSSLNMGWVLLNEYEVANYNYQKKQQLSSINYYPARGYGDIIFLNEYVGISEVDFYSGLVSYKLQAMLNREKLDKSVRRIVWESYKTDNEIFNLFLASVTEVVNENDLDQSVKQKIIDTFKNNAAIDIGVIKAKSNYTFERLYKYPPVPIFEAKNKSVKTFSVRKDFSTLTVKTGALFVPGEDAFSTGSYISIYPAVKFASYEKYSQVLDSISIDIGVAGKSSNDNASEDFNDASERYMLGIGYDLGGNFSVQIGTVLWDNGDKMDNAGYFGISLDLLNLASDISK